jgi:hypothetical protein
VQVKNKPRVRIRYICFILGSPVHMVANMSDFSPHVTGTKCHTFCSVRVQMSPGCSLGEGSFKHHSAERFGVWETQRLTLLLYCSLYCILRKLFFEYTASHCYFSTVQNVPRQKTSQQQTSQIQNILRLTSQLQNALITKCPNHNPTQASEHPNYKMS